MKKNGIVGRVLAGTSLVVWLVTAGLPAAAQVGQAVSNIADFWRSGNIAELAKGPNQGLM